jgi:hypothetical protein
MCRPAHDKPYARAYRDAGEHDQEFLGSDSHFVPSTRWTLPSSARLSDHWQIT